MAKTRIGIVAALLVLGFVGAANAATDAASFVADLSKQGVAILRSGTDLSHRQAAFAAIFKADFDVPAIGKFVLGRYWKTATPEQQQQYLSVFGDYVVAIYSERFANYTDADIKVTGSTANDAQITTVKSEVIPREGEQPIAVEWQVAQEGGSYKILNVVVENLSMSLSQRQEFSSVIEQNGGSIDALIAQLKAKIKK